MASGTPTAGGSGPATMMSGRRSFGESMPTAAFRNSRVEGATQHNHRLVDHVELLRLKSARRLDEQGRVSWGSS